MSSRRARTFVTPPAPALPFGRCLYRHCFQEDRRAWLMQLNGWSISTAARSRLVPGGVNVRDPAKLRSPATDRLVWQAVFGSRRRAGGRPLAALGAGAGNRGPPGLHQRSVPGPGPGRMRAALPFPRSTSGCWPTTPPGRSSAPPRRGKAGAIILEIARSEIAYTEQRPAEYVAVHDRRPRSARATPCRSSSRATTARSITRSTRPIPRAKSAR